MRVCLVALALVLAACGASASPDVTKVRDPAAVAAGEVLYQANCARCHGEDADGGRVPDGPLAPSLVSRTGPSDQLLIDIVKRGRGLNMPSWQNQLDEAEIVSIIDFVRSLQVARLEE